MWGHRDLQKVPAQLQLEDYAGVDHRPRRHAQPPVAAPHLRKNSQAMVHHHGHRQHRALHPGHHPGHDLHGRREDRPEEPRGDELRAPHLRVQQLHPPQRRALHAAHGRVPPVGARRDQRRQRRERAHGPVHRPGVRHQRLRRVPVHLAVPARPQPVRRVEEVGGAPHVGGGACPVVCGARCHTLAGVFADDGHLGHAGIHVVLAFCGGWRVLEASTTFTA
mmetsp:Transcript_21086/g.40862  ORF Transcript_21086/g.40862 Transcript_21086/m.40862 type:complete len:221 (-) Transcript_21086:94-756(-)